MSPSSFSVKKHVLPCQHLRHYPRSTQDGDNDSLHIAINQYTPLDNSKPRPGDITIIAAHANGIGKELYEPLFDDLYKTAKQTKAFGIRGIWIADVASQGESGVLNENKLGNDPSWYDHPRDLLHMINHFRDQMPRPLVGMGHSMGGNNIVNLSLIHPTLFTTVILVDPVIQRFSTAVGNYMPAVASTGRRDIWPSREEAAAAFRRNKFYQSWDPRVLDRLVTYGLRDLPTAIFPAYPSNSSNAQAATSLASSATSAAPVPPSAPPPKPVTLTTTKHQEVFSFLRENHPARDQTLESHSPSRATHPDIPLGVPAKPFYRPEPIITFALLPHLRPSCFYVFGADSPLSGPQFQKDKLEMTGVGVGGNGGVREGRTTSVSVKGAGHFVPFEKSSEVAALVSAWIGKELLRSNALQAEERREWEALDKRARMTMSEDRLYWIKGLVNNPKKAPVKQASKAKL